jgi:hypothetical protein
MEAGLPGHFFRLRDHTVQVFRVNTDTPHRRIEMDPVAVLNLRSGEVRAQAGRTLTETDRAAIDRWLADRRQLDAAREMDGVLATVDRLNLTAHWAQTRATDADLDRVTDDLLMAMHDLRTVLVRRMAARIEHGADDADDVP